MHPRSTIRRRCVALVLAYVLALQAILLAWALLTPTIAGFAPPATLCATYASDEPPPLGSDNTGCPCGPLCSAGGCGWVGAPAPSVIQAVVYYAECRAWHTSCGEAGIAQNASREPGQARAPPALA